MSTMDRPPGVRILRCGECSCYPELCPLPGSAQAGQLIGMFDGSWIAGLQRATSNWSPTDGACLVCPHAPGPRGVANPTCARVADRSAGAQGGQIRDNPAVGGVLDGDL
jgi:hypothetical protein